VLSELPSYDLDAIQKEAVLIRHLNLPVTVWLEACPRCRALAAQLATKPPRRHEGPHPFHPYTAALLIWKKQRGMAEVRLFARLKMLRLTIAVTIAVRVGLPKLHDAFRGAQIR
jgi:hypothetical protein